MWIWMGKKETYWDTLQFLPPPPPPPPKFVTGYINFSSKTQLFLKGSFGSAWQSSSDRRMLTQSMKLILWSIISLNKCYLFLYEGRHRYNNKKCWSFWLFLKMFLLHKDVSRRRPRGSRFVWVIICVRPTSGYLHCIHISHLTEIQTSKILKLFDIPNRPNGKTSRK